MADTTLSIPMWAMLFRLAEGKRDVRPNQNTWDALERRGLVRHGQLTSEGVALNIPVARLIQEPKP